jgi:nucleoid-associated protein YgaU
MTSRYDNRRLIKNDLEEYESFFEERDINYIVQYNTKSLRYPTVDQISNLTRVQHVWKVGDRYYKLASQFYGNPRYWWIIAHYNKKPTEADLTVGDIIYIPTPLEKILNYVLE